MIPSTVSIKNYLSSSSASMAALTSLSPAAARAASSLVLSATSRWTEDIVAEEGYELPEVLHEQLSAITVTLDLDRLVCVTSGVPLDLLSVQ